MMVRSPNYIFKAAWYLWPVCALFLWIFWLVGVPIFLGRAANGSLPFPVINGVSPAQIASEGAAAWGIGIGTWSWINTAVNGVTFLAFSLVAFLIWGRVRSGFGLLTAFILLLGGSNSMNVAIYGAQLSTAALKVWELTSIVWLLFFPWLYLFPNGRAVPKRLLWVLGPMFFLIASLLLIAAVRVLENSHPFETIIDTLQLIFEAITLFVFSLVFGAQIYRYIKVSNPTEKKQTMWFLFGLGVALIPTGLLTLFGGYPAELETITFVALPLGIGISLLRYRLWDIDVIIRKTLVYSALTGVLALIYFGLVILLQTLFESVSGQQSPVALVISTLVIAALFGSLRRRVQGLIDRRFFRQKYNAQRVMAQFAQTARDEVSLEALTAELSRVLEETMQPEQMSIWLKHGGDTSR